VVRERAPAPRRHRLDACHLAVEPVDSNPVPVEDATAVSSQELSIPMTRIIPCKIALMRPG